MSEEIKHAQITTTEPLPDGSIKVVTESHYDFLAHRTESIKKQFPTNKRDVLKDLLTCIEPLVQGAVQVNIQIHKKPDGQWWVTRDVMVLKESFKRK